MAITDKERFRLVEYASTALDKAKTKKEVRKVFEHEKYGYLVLGHKILGRLRIGQSIEEATAKRGKKA